VIGQLLGKMVTYAKGRGAGMLSEVFSSLAYHIPNFLMRFFTNLEVRYNLNIEKTRKTS
jgi:peptidoglycan biosynthesis protein MviN/MurJ (putative lipid II flippase)